jgi:biotin-(acetyl-CoA carboxylase) ligase
VNASVSLEDLDPKVAASAATLNLPVSAMPGLRRQLAAALMRLVATDRVEILRAFRARDGLCGREVHWDGMTGVAEGIDDDGHLLARTSGGELVRLLAGEVHLSAVR